jgi:hypothetical protein
MGWMGCFLTSLRVSLIFASWTLSAFAVLAG